MHNSSSADVDIVGSLFSHHQDQCSCLRLFIVFTHIHHERDSSKCLSVLC